VDPSGILTSVLILGGVGLTFGVLIALANKKLKVWEDPRIDQIVDILPGANCGACGLAGCRAFAEGVVEGVIAPAGCTVMGEGGREELAEFLGVDAGEASKVVARLLCAGGTDVAPRKARYHGLASCGAAVSVSGGGKGCAWGCVGFGDCQVACDFDAILMTANELPLVDVDKCTACGDCVVACPLDLFVLMPLDHKLIVQCRNLLDGDAAEAVCSVACTACGRCVQDAAPGLIEIDQGLAVVDYGKIETQNPEAVSRCPTNAIVWVEGAQGFAELELVGSE
jgi:Na+-translocating ferredoxin:NAD+ oxidoreductase RNF subunit RnfB